MSTNEFQVANQYSRHNHPDLRLSLQQSPLKKAQMTANIKIRKIEFRSNNKTDFRNTNKPDIRSTLKMNSSYRNEASRKEREQSLKDNLFKLDIHI